jgi:drug/metabolite transporter (DMT)-like permease
MSWILLVLISAVLFAAGNIVRKYVLAKEHPLEFLAARGFFTIMILFLLVPWVDTSIDLRVLGLIYLSSVVAAMGYYYQTKAQRHTDISYLSPLQNLSPLFLLIIAYLFLNETPTVVQLVGVFAIVLGSYTLTLKPNHSFLEPLRELKKHYWMHIWLSVILLAIAAALDKFLLGKVRPVTYLFFGWLFMNLNYIIVNLLIYEWDHIAVDFKKGWRWLLLAAVLSVASMLSFYYAIALPTVLISLALPLRKISTLLETLFGGTLFHEKNLAQRLFACVIILIGVLLIVR